MPRKSVQILRSCSRFCVGLFLCFVALCYYLVDTILWALTKISMQQMWGWLTLDMCEVSLP